MSDDTTTDTAPDLAPEKTITLDPPVKFGGVDYGTLQLREPTAGEMIECDDVRGYAWMAKLSAKVGGVPPAVTTGMRVREILEAGEYLLGFTTAGRRTSSAG